MSDDIDTNDIKGELRDIAKSIDTIAAILFSVVFYHVLKLFL